MQKKKSILLIFTGAMELGGIERSLLGLLESIDYDRYEIDLFLYAHHGELFSYIDPRVNLLPEVKELAYLGESFKKKIRHGCYYAAALRLRDEIRSKTRPINYYETWAQIVRLCVPRIEKHYDMALGFFRPFDLLKEKVNADIKIGWIHTDYSNSNELEIKGLRKDFSGLDYIAAVSESCKSAFETVLPEFRKKTIIVENVLPKEFVQKQAELFSVHSEMPADGCIRLLSIGRFCKAKNFDNIPEICKIIRDEGINVVWYLIGYGNDEGIIKERITRWGMDEYVIILGKKTNPYPYIRECDIYVQPSRYEGKSVSVREAQILCRPLVITNYATASSQVQDGIDGVISPMDNEGIAKTIIELIKDKGLQGRLSANMAQRDYSNTEAIEVLDGYLNHTKKTDRHSLKIYTITCHDVYNVGASLQAHALWKYLSLDGHDVRIIDYKPEYLSRHYSLAAVNNPKYDKPLVKQTYLLAKMPKRLKALKSTRKKMFDSFRDEYMMLTEQTFHTCDEIGRGCADGDLYIAGSDQIWNPIFQNGKDPAFFLRFVKDPDKRSSYAASIAAEEISEIDKQRIISWVREIKHVSVREQKAADILSKAGVQSVQVCDPVFLLAAEYWKGIARRPKGNGYLFVYDFDNSLATLEIAKNLSQKKHKEIYSYFPMQGQCVQTYGVGPREFLGLLMNADIVMSNSFHATAFALLFHKEFYVVKRREGINSRMIDLLGRLQLGDRIITCKEDISNSAFIDWDRVDALLDKEIIASKAFLKQVIAERLEG